MSAAILGQRALSLAAGLFFLISTPSAGQANMCLPQASDSGKLVQRIKWLLSDTSETSALARSSIGIDNVNGATVAVVVDSTACARGTNAITTRFQVAAPDSAQFMFVLVGARYMAYDPGSSGHTLVFVLDQTLQYVKSIFGF